MVGVVLCFDVVLFRFAILSLIALLVLGFINFVLS